MFILCLYSLGFAFVYVSISKLRMECGGIVQYVYVVLAHSGRLY